MRKPTAQLCVGGPIIVKWPANNPAIERIAFDGDESVGIWTAGGRKKMTARAKFMVLQDLDTLQHAGELVGETELPWFGRCRVFRLFEH